MASEASEPNYYRVLGVEPTADAAAIDAAYRGRLLPFRVGQLRRRSEEIAGPTQEEIEQAYAILSNPESRTLYDAVYFPDKPPPTAQRRRVPVWLWAILAAWIVALVVIAVVGVRSRTRADTGAIDRIISLTATAEQLARAAGGSATGTPPPAPTGTTPASPTTATTSATVAVALPPTATIAAASATSATAPSATATTRPAPTPIQAATSAPTQAPTLPPTATATVAPTLAPTLAPTPTALPPTATPAPPPPPSEPPPPPPPPPPAPTPTPIFRATDRIGTPLSVNLRSGPGSGFSSLGLLPTGTLLQATGEAATSGGQLWRRFRLQDGRVGWVRDLDVLVVR